MSHHSQTYVSPHVPRIPVSVALFNEPRPFDLDGEHKLPAGRTQDSVDMNGYDIESGERKKTAGMYVHIQREVHHDVSNL